MKNETLFAEERKIKIAEYIEEHKQATVAQLCDHFDVSSATVRNDLRELANANLLIRTHGGAIVKSQTAFELQSKQKTDQNLEAKASIAAEAIKLIENGDTIIIDSGTTTFELSKLLKAKRDLTVITNDLNTALILEESDTINVIVIGGFLRRGFHCAVGMTGQNMLVGLTVDKAFMGVNGFTFTKGATTPDFNHGQVKKSMIAIAKKVILLCDHTKIGREAFVQFAEPDEIDTVVTDKVSEEDGILFEENGIEVISAS